MTRVLRGLEIILLIVNATVTIYENDEGSKDFSIRSNVEVEHAKPTVNKKQKERLLKKK
jgi:hypothetical protein